MKRAQFYIVIFIFVYVNNIFATESTFIQNNDEIQEINLLDKKSGDYIEFYSTDMKNFSNSKTINKYPSSNLFDGSLHTCWISSSIKTYKNSAIYMKLPDKIPLDKLILNIFSGYGKNKTLYLKNARPKRIKISIYASYNPEGYSSELAVKYFNKRYSVKIIELKDMFAIQSFPLNLDKKKMLTFFLNNKQYCKESLGDKNIKIKDIAFMLKLEIVDIYKGVAYKDVCISEIFFNNRFVTRYPSKYTEVKNVYIKDDNILMADYVHEKNVVVYNDTSAIFTMLDWDKNENFAILHYVQNDEVGGGSRVQEHYSLVDLKNIEIVDKKFKKYTGDNPLFGILEKKSKHLFMTNIDDYDIELK